MDVQSARDVFCPDNVFKDDSQSYSTCSKSDSTAVSSSWTSTTRCGVEPTMKSESLTNDPVRKEVLKALAWAAHRTFKYRPSDPVHYFAYQLLRWRYGNPSDKNSLF